MEVFNLRLAPWDSWQEHPTGGGSRGVAAITPRGGHPYPTGRATTLVVNACLALSAVAFCAASAQAANVDVQWDNGAANNDWGNATNWSGDILPDDGLGTGLSTSGDKLHINLSGASRAIYSAATGSNTYQTIRVGDANSGGELEVTGGTLKTDGTPPTYIAYGGRTATLTQSGGTVSFGGYMQVGLNNNSVGNINLSGGTLISGRNGTVGGVTGVSMVLGDGNNAQGNFILSGGEFRTRTGVLLGNPTTTGKGRFEVRGAGIANIGTDNTSDDGYWAQSLGSTLAAYVNAGALGSIFVDKLNGTTGTPNANGNTYDDGNVIFEAGSLLEAGFLGAPTNGSWDLMKWEGTLTNKGLAFAPGVTDSNWSFAFVDTDLVNGPDTLRITYGPPPPPNGLVAIPGDQQVRLVWSSSSSATSYKIRSGTNSGGPYTVTNTATTGSYTSSGLVNGTRYYYVVSAVNGGNEGGLSSEVNAIPFHSKFIHPGGMHTQADFDRMKAKVAAGAQPWLSGWIELTNNSHAELTYAANPQTNVYRGFDGVNPENYSILFNDIAAAYQLALRYHVSGDSNYANAGVQIMNAWSATLTNIAGTSDQFLVSGIYGYQFANVGEMMRNYPGWGAADFVRFQNLMLNVFYPMNHDFLVQHNGACIGHYWANWDLCNMASIAAIGVLCDDQAKFDEAVNYFKTGAGNGAIGTAVYYLHPGQLGQWQESGRDQGHNTLGVALMGPLCEVAWNQGVDLYGYAGNRFLAGCEYIAKYNLTNTVPYVTYNNCDEVNQTVIATNGQGTIRACWEMVYNHYVNRKGLAAPYTLQITALARPEGGGGNYGPNSGGYDQLGFGTLTYTRDPSGAVPPASPSVPTGLTATAPTCGQINLSWNSVAGATSYGVMRSTTSGEPYTTVVALEVGTTNYADTSVLGVTTYYYVISAANAGGESDFSAQSSATSSVCPLAGGWLTTDVGSVTTAGGAKFDGTSFTLKGAGSDIGGTGDSFRFVYRSLTNSGQIIARWASMDPGGSQDKVGLMMRESTNAGSKTAALLYDDNNSFNRLRLPRRTSTGGSMSYPGPDGSTGASAPLWMRLARTNDIFTGYYSNAGTNWTLVASATNASTPATILVGMEVSSRNANWLDTSAFDNVSVSGVWPPPVSLAPPQMISSFTGGQLQLSWPSDHFGWRLEAQTNSLSRGLGTNWITVLGSTSTNQISIPIGVDNGSAFFRLVYP
jgi:Alginate lyase/Fibronectin type III domain